MWVVIVTPFDTSLTAARSNRAIGNLLIYVLISTLVESTYGIYSPGMDASSIDWAIVAGIAGPLVVFFLGVLGNRLYESKQRLVVYLTNFANFTIRSDKSGVDDIHLRTFSLVIRNAGRRATNSVKIGHHWLPKDVTIFPAIPHHIDNSAPGNASEVQIDQLVSGEQITISYLLWDVVQPAEVISYVKSDDGQARVLDVLPTPQLPKWTQRLLWILIFIGIVTILYTIYTFYTYIF